MAEYIWREEAIKAIESVPDGNWRSIQYAKEVKAIPAADVAPVRHGRWVTKKDACGRDYTICSACETEIKWRDRRGVMLIVDMQNAPYCPNCGASMKDGNGDV